MGNKVTVEVTEQTLYNIDILEDELTVVTVEIPQDIVTVEISQFTVSLELYNSDNDADGQPVYSKSGSDFTLRSFTDDDKTIAISHSGPSSELIEVKLPDSGIRVQDAFVMSSDSDDTANIVFNGSTIDINGVGDIAVNTLTAGTATVTTGTVTTLSGTTMDYDAGTIDTLTATDITTGTIGATTATIGTGNITTVNATALNTATLDTTGDATVGGSLQVDVDTSVTGNVAITGNVSALNATMTGTTTTGDLQATTGTITTGEVTTLTGTTATITTVNATDVNSTNAAITTVNATTVNTDDLTATDQVTAARVDASTRITTPLGNITTVNATDVNTVDATVTGTVTAPIGDITTVNATDVNSTNVTATTGGIATVNATTVNSTDVNTTNASVTGTATIATGDITTVNATDVNSTNVTATTGDITTVNATTVNTNAVNAADITLTGDITARDATLSRDVVIGGNLTVSGTTTTINTETLEVADNNIVLNSNHTGTPTQNGGITIERGTEDDALLQWNETSDKFEVKVGLVDAVLRAETFEGNLTASQATITTGDITTVNATTVNSTDVNTTNVVASDIDTVDLDATGTVTATTGSFTTLNVSGVIGGATAINDLSALRIGVENPSTVDGDGIVLWDKTTNWVLENKYSTQNNQDDVVHDGGEAPIGDVLYITNSSIEMSGNIVAAGAQDGTVITSGRIALEDGAGTGSNITVDAGNGIVMTGQDIRDTGNIIPAVHLTSNLGSPSKAWHSIYVGPGSLYIDGHKVLGSDAEGQIDITTDDGQNLNIFAGANGPGGDIIMGSAGGTTSLQDATINLTTQSGTVNVLGTLEAPNTNIGDLEINGTLINQTGVNQNLEIRTNGTGYLHANVADMYVGPLTGAVKIDENTISSTVNDLTVTGDLIGNVTGQVSDISNHTTTDLTEGTNLYYTDARARTAVSLVTDSTDLVYDDVTGVFTYQTPVGAPGDAATLVQTVRNTTGATIPAGSAVYISGVSGLKTLVALADADDALARPAIGIVTTALANNSDGPMTFSGEIQPFNTTGYTENQSLYLSTTPGVITGTRPAGQATSVQVIGRVVRAGVSNGIIMVTGAGRANDTPNLSNKNVFIGTATNGVDQRQLTTADILEDASNLFYTDARAQAVINTNTAGFITDITGESIFDLSDTMQVQPLAPFQVLGYNPDASAFVNANLTTNEIPEGDNLYFTEDRVGAWFGTSGLPALQATELTMSENFIVNKTGDQRTTVGDSQVSGQYDTHGFKVEAGATAWASVTLDEHVGDGSGNKPITSFSNPVLVGQVWGGTPSAQTAVPSGKRLMTMAGQGSYDDNGTIRQPPAASSRVLMESTENFTSTARGTSLKLQTTPNGSAGLATTLELQGNTVKVNPDGDGYIQSGGDLILNDDVTVTGDLKVEGKAVTNLNPFLLGGM